MIIINSKADRIFAIFLIVVLLITFINPFSVYACLKEKAEEARAKADKAAEDYKEALKEVEKKKEALKEIKDDILLGLFQGAEETFTMAIIEILKREFRPWWQKLQLAQEELKAAEAEAEIYYEIWQTWQQRYSKIQRENQEKLPALERKIAAKKREIARLKERIAALEAEIRRRREEEGDSSCPGLVAELERLKQVKAAKEAELADLEEEHGC